MQRDLYAYCIVLILLLNSFVSNSQNQFNNQIISKTENYINSLSPNSIIELGLNSGYIISGSVTESNDKGFLVKTDENGMFTWGKSIFLNENDNVGHVETLMVADGLISMYNVTNFENFPAIYKILIIKFSNEGEVVWSKSYQTSQYVFVFDIAETNSGFIIGGSVNNDLDNSLNQLFLANLDFNGDVLWSRMLQHENAFTAHAILVNNDGSFYVGAQVGKSEEEGISRYGLMHLSEDGSAVLWAKTFRNSAIIDLFTCDPSRILKTSSGDLIFTGNQNLGNGDLLNPEILKLSPDGTLLKNIWIAGASAANMNAILANDEIFLFGNALLTGTGPSTPGAELSQIVDGNVILKFDLDLTPVWSKRLGILPLEYREDCGISTAANGEILTVFGTYSGNYGIPYLDIRRMDPVTGNTNSCEKLEYSKDRFIQDDAMIIAEFEVENELIDLTSESVDPSFINYLPLEFENKTYCIESNAAPVITKDLPNITIEASQEFVLDLTDLFIEPDLDDKMVFYAAEGDNWFSAYLPEWITFDTTAMTLSGLPNPGDLGTYRFHIVAVDFAGHQSIEQFTLTVELANRPPYSLQTISNKVIRSGKEFKYVFPVTLFDDPDQDELTYSLTLEDGTPLPTWLTFSPETRTVVGYPTDNHISTEHTLRYTASDGALISSVDFTITVEANQSPTPIALVSPANATLFSEETQSITFTWTSSTDPDGDRILYQLQISDDTDLLVEYELTATEITLPIKDFPFEKELSWFVRATDGGINADTDLRTFSIKELVTGIENPSMKNATLYPNPANTNLFVSADIVSPSSITIENLQGSIVLKQNLEGTNELDVETLPPGLYIARISSAGKIYSTKLLICR